MEENTFELMRTLLNSCDDICYVKDKNGIYLYVNSAFCFRSQKSEQEIIGQNDTVVFPEVAEQLMANDQRIMASRQAETVEEEGYHENTYFCYKSSKTPLINESNEVYGLSGLAFDYTETKLLENERTELLAKLKTSNKTLNHLFSVISHDLKEPFNSLMTTSQLLLDNCTNIDKETSQAMLLDINSAAKSTFYLLENLLYWSLQQINNIKPDIQNSNIAKLIKTCIAPYKVIAKNKNIKLSISIAKETQLQLDEQMMSIVFANLINNAIKFTGDCGVITFFTIEADEHCDIFIKDNGMGIAEEALNGIFDIKKSSLGTENEKGTGIGLNLCKKLIEQIGGTISIESKLGVGTTIKLHLKKI